MGVLVISEIVLKNGRDFPLVDSNNIRGGCYLVNTLQERDSIPDKRLKNGMLCFVLETKEYYKYLDGIWDTLTTSGLGIPILDNTLIELLELENKLPDKYISIPDVDDLNGNIDNNKFETSANGNYVDVLFKSLRALLLEVSRLKNSFKYGIQSYTGTKTAISSEIPNSVEEEPLWAIDENALSRIPEASISINENCELLPKNNLNLGYPGKVIINGTAYWEDSNHVLSFLDDSKLITYITTNSLNLLIILKDTKWSSLLSLDLNRFNLPKFPLYNITLIVSRNIKNSKNYIWLSINSDSDTLLEGYLNGYNIYPTELELSNTYTLYKYIFNNLSLFKCNTYTKYEDFSEEVIPSVPEEDSYKYKVAHITIRAVDKYSLLTSILNQLPDNELVWSNLELQLYIKTAKGAVAIGSAQKPNDDGMTEEQIIEKLKSMGILYTDGKGLLLSSLSDITFINLDTNKQFKFEVDAYGKLRSSEIPKTTLTDKVNTTTFTDYDIRGFVGQVGRQDYQKDNNTQLRRDIPFETHADRIKIGAFYPPLKDAKVFGCSHAYIELENTSGKDFPLDGCYLHYAYGDDSSEGGEANVTAIHHLALKGVLKAGSTYLIRGKKYAEFEDKNVKIKVKEFDLEWYVDGLLIDLTRHLRNGLALTYGLPNLTLDTPLWKSSKTIVDGSSDSTHTYLSLLKILDSGEEVINSYYPNIAKCPLVYETYFIDSLYYINTLGKGNPWAVGKGMVMPESKNKDCIFKNTFQLDPAMLAFQSLNKFDSSRVRWLSANDYQCVYLDKDYIEFPKTPEGKMRVDLYTPKASYEYKNVSTDKTKMDLNKPNVVFCSMGIDIYKTRTFNWISAGYDDEYVWIRKKNDLEWSRFESYKKGEVVLPQEAYPKRKEYSEETKSIVYNRFSGRFPGDGTYFTSHKCVVDITDLNVEVPTTYEYVVGKSKIDSTDFDPEHSSKLKTFTLYPTSYTPRIYQHSDEQGFDWIQYQVWGAAASNLNDKINEDMSREHIIPILVDTGDVVQNGTRINEWLDYYSGGECLFDHLEAMDVVGNNDLCDTDPSILGTGDDDGKSNSFYFHIFHCLDINENPLVSPIINKTFIPSLYYLDTDLYRILMINSELTYINCRDWFKLGNSDETVSSIYTGYKIGTNTYDSERFRTKETISSSNLDVPIYTKLYILTDPTHELGTTKKIVCACHEMPFTVITNSSLLIVDMAKKQEPTNDNRMTGLEQYTRSINELNLLIGSHLNQIDPKDTGKGIYWFSRLLEFRGIKLCIGGHKHTYACSYPVRENYNYIGEDGLVKQSYEAGPMKMDITLENDSATWTLENYEMLWMSRGSDTLDLTTQFNINTTKIPLVEHVSDTLIENTQIKAVNDKGGIDYYGVVMLPRYNVPTLSGGVIYFMCLATGYKYASNKELPSQYQAFSQLKPHTTLPVKDKFKDTASADQMRPMFSTINLSTNIDIKLARVEHIFLRNSKGKYIFNQVSFDKAPMSRMYLNKADDEYGIWSPDESVLITINY